MSHEHRAHAIDRLTVIVPVKWSATKPDCAIRLLANCAALQRLGIRHAVIADGSAVTTPFRMLAAAFGFEHRPVQCRAVYSPSKVKNASLEGISDERYVLFLDVDVLLTDGALARVLSQIEAGVVFDWLPVIFLDKRYGTSAMLSHSFSAARRADVRARVQVGYTTGIQLINAGFFRHIGGYLDCFTGYGCEDIEMIHRATGVLDRRPIYPLGAEYYQDVRSHDPLGLAGFRRSYYEMCRHVDIESMPLHYWHKRRNQSNYMLRRKLNDTLLLEAMVAYDEQLGARRAAKVAATHA